jgi:Mg-chelatase subunit ChlD
MARKGPTIIELVIVCAIFLIIGNILYNRRAPGGAAPETAPEEQTQADARALAQLETKLAPPAGTTWKDGLAAVVLVDVSGSMHDRIAGERRRKIEAAQQAANDLVGAFARYAAAHTDQAVQVGVYEFSARSGEAAAREVVPIGAPNPAVASAAIEQMKARGGTPIGDAMVEARLALDRTGLARRHMLVVTDGENTDGADPALVARAFEHQKDDVRASLYFVAFDVDAQAFAGVKQAGGLLLSAKSGSELAATVDELLSDRILVEAPRETVEKPRTPIPTPPTGAAKPPQ